MTEPEAIADIRLTLQQGGCSGLALRVRHLLHAYDELVRKQHEAEENKTRDARLDLSTHDSGGDATRSTP